jgi:hypothetical protein
MTPTVIRMYLFEFFISCVNRYAIDGKKEEAFWTITNPNEAAKNKLFETNHGGIFILLYIFSSHKM